MSVGVGIPCHFTALEQIQLRYSCSCPVTAIADVAMGGSSPQSQLYCTTLTPFIDILYSCAPIMGIEYK